MNQAESTSSSLVGRGAGLAGGRPVEPECRGAGAGLHDLLQRVADVGRDVGALLVVDDLLVG